MKLISILEIATWRDEMPHHKNVEILKCQIVKWRNKCETFHL
jgi:hypothetical protein